MAATRRLAAIFAADVAGYSRLMGADEEGTLARLKALRRELVDPKIAEHRGRIVKTTGDGMLIEFASVVDALRCATEVQAAMRERNGGAPLENRIEFRIGINVGDVVAEDGDIFGDGVNIAARIEGLAEPGGICISARVQEDTAGKLDLVFEDMGEQQLKNIARPVRVFRVRAALTHPDAGAPGSPLSRSAGEGGERRRREAGEGSPPLPLPDKPSVAVLPFNNMSPDPEQEFFADGIAEDIITSLSRYPSLFVIARNSCFTYKGHAVDVKQVGRDLGVRYVLEGSLRKSGNRIRVTAQLVEAETGKHIWAERYDRDPADIFAVQDEIAQAVTIAIAPAVAAAELQRAMRKPPGSLDAWAAFQRGLWHISKFTADDNAIAQRFFQRAIDLDPAFSGGYWGLGAVHYCTSYIFPTRGPIEELSAIVALMRRAVALDDGDGEARSWLSVILQIWGDARGALAESERALVLSPNLAIGHSAHGHVLTWSGRPREGLAALQTSFRLDPRNPWFGAVRSQFAVAHYFLCEYEAAVEVAEEAVRSYPDFPLNWFWLPPALAQLGRTAEAREALKTATAIGSRVFDAFVRQRMPFMRPEDYDHILDGLRKAGWSG